MENQRHIDYFLTAQSEFFDSDPLDSVWQIKLDDAIHAAEQATATGYAPAMAWLGQNYFYGYYELPVDQVRGLDLLHRAADLGDVLGTFILGNAYSETDLPNYYHCADFLSRIAPEHVGAKAKLGQLLIQEKITTDTFDFPGVDDYITYGRDLLMQAAEQGSALASLVLGEFSYHDLDDEDRKKKAYVFFEKGIEAYPASGDDPWVKAKLLRFKGSALQNGIGVDADPQAGFALLQNAADQGDEEAKAILNQDHLNPFKNQNAFKVIPFAAAVESPSDFTTIVESFDADERIADMVGWDEAKKIYQKIHRTATLHTDMKLQKGGLSPHFILSGPPGTGKNIFIDIITRKLHDIGYLNQPKYIVCDLLGVLTRNSSAISDYINAARGGILVVRDSRRKDFSDSLGDIAATEEWTAQQLYLAASKADHDVLLCLYQEEESGDYEMDRLLRKYADLARSVRIRIQFEAFKPADILQIFIKRLHGMGYEFTESLRALAMQEIERRIEKGSILSVNAHIVADLVFETLVKAAQLERQTGQGFAISSENLPVGDWFGTRDLKEILRPLNHMVGLENVKNQVSDLTYLLNAQKQRAERNDTVRTIPAPHFVFTGPPGTGKTTVARLMGKMLHDLGYLSRGHVVETDATSMIGKYWGHTAPLVRELMDKADGGILFIDEAYSLGQPADGGPTDTYRDEAVSTLLKLMEDRRGRMVVIVAGYSKEMQRFLDANSGIRSRFTQIIDFGSFTADDLVRIFAVMCEKESLVPSEAAIAALKEHVAQLRTFDQITEFGNARGIRNIFEKSISIQARRSIEQELLVEKANILEVDDLSFRQKKHSLVTSQQFDESMQPLKKLIGLKSVKEEIERLSALAQSQMMRQSASLPRVPMVLHSLFTGAPGTGKTTVARLFGKILADMGYLEKGHVVEVDQSGMIGMWLGHTPNIVKQKVEMADGGILFIDEAYALAGHSGTNSSYGDEAMSTLLKFMEDRRDRFVVIAAGYTKEMERLIESNSGLLSRFPNHLVFESYDHAQMLDIFKVYAAEYGVMLDQEAEDRVLAYLKSKDKDALDALGNGRLMRNIFEKTVATQAKRILDNNLSPEHLKTFVAADITFPRDPKDSKIVGFV